MSQPLTSAEIRSAFCRFFEERGHTRVKSSLLIPAGDPTLLFTNAGMVQFKQIFLGEEKRSYSRAVSVQKCLRAGGKHNDLENVGMTARHHTFFEMLGNFSFGDYFKKEAIDFGWEFVTRLLGLPKDRLWVTVFREDDDAARIWSDHISPERIIRMGEKDNFWQMGDTGPCGPCSEIYIDQGAKAGCGKPDCRVGCDCDRFLEIWNLVFMQYNRIPGGKLEPLPRPSIDTGMGLERVSAVCQGVLSNYDSDLFTPLIRVIEKISKTPYGKEEKQDKAIRVIADHIRAITFLISDGVVPSNEGRGYVLRRIMRRASRYGRNLGLTAPFLHELSGTVVDMMKPVYTELSASQSKIRQIILAEEERFIHTLDAGMKIIEEILVRMKREKIKTIPAADSFRLYDTYGFPIDLLEDICREEGFQLDKSGFQQEMETQKKKARAASRFAQEDPGVQKAYKSVLEQTGKTRFLGYEKTEADSQIVAILKGTERIRKAGAGEEVLGVFRETPFYGEGGGQVGDRGWVTADPDLRAEVIHTFKPLPEFFVHKMIVREGEVRENQTVHLQVDPDLRAATARNHTATHLLHAVLREVLGDHVKQAGSYVGPDRLRFDFNHFVSLNARELEKIEAIVNERILMNVGVTPEEKGIEEALKGGALAFFGDKYGDTVRVVKIPGLSQELCGGTHCRATGEIGSFKITGESSVAAGVRRIEALTGMASYRQMKKTENLLAQMTGRLKSREEDALLKLQKLLDSVKEKEKEISQIKLNMNARGPRDSRDEIKKIGEASVLIKKIDGLNPRDLREALDRFRSRPEIDIVILGSSLEGKVFLIVGVRREKTGQYHAGEIVKAISLIVEGTGGGKPDMAQGGGKNPARLDEALQTAEAIIGKNTSPGSNA